MRFSVPCRPAAVPVPTSTGSETLLRLWLPLTALRLSWLRGHELSLREQHLHTCRLNHGPPSRRGVPSCLLSNQDAGPHSDSLQVRGPRFRERQLDDAGGNRRWGRVCGVLSLAGPADERGRLGTAQVCGINQLKFGPALTGSAPAALRTSSPVGEYGPPTPASDPITMRKRPEPLPIPDYPLPSR